MLILIVKDSATQVPREVRDLQEAQGFADQGHHVLVQSEDGTKVPLAEAIAQMRTAVEGVTGASVAGFEAKAAEPKKPKGIVAKVKAAVTRKKK